MGVNKYSRKIPLNTGRKRIGREVVEIEVGNGFTQLYDILIEVLPSLGFCSNGMLFFIWLCVRAGGEFERGVRVAKDVVDDFNGYLMEHGRKKVGKVMVHRYVSELCERGVLVPVSRGYYYFNINYVWRGGKAQRENYLRLQYADQKMLPVIVDAEIKEITD